MNIRFHHYNFLLKIGIEKIITLSINNVISYVFNRLRREKFYSFHFFCKHIFSHWILIILLILDNQYLAGSFYHFGFYLYLIKLI